MELSTEASAVETTVSERIADFIDGPEVEEELQENESEEGTEAELDEESDEDEPEFEEATDSVEVDGQVIDLPEGTPPEVVEAVTAAIAEKERSLKADYTQKTQDAAEMRRAATAFYEQTQQQSAFIQQHIDSIAQLKNIESRLQEYNGLLTTEFLDADPVAYLKYDHARKNLESSHKTMINELENQSKQVEMQASQARAQQFQQLAIIEQEANLLLTKAIPGWGVDYANKIRNFAAKTYGYTVELDNMFDARHVRVLSDAYKYEELKTKGVKAKQVPEVARKFVKPGAKLNQSTESERRARQNLRDTGKGAASLIAKYL